MNIAVIFAGLSHDTAEDIKIVLDETGAHTEIKISQA